MHEFFQLLFGADIAAIQSTTTHLDLAALLLTMVAPDFHVAATS